MNSRKPTTEIVGKENKEKTIASTPKYTGTQGPTSVVKPGDSLNGTKSTNNDEADLTVPRSSVASRFMDALSSPTLRQSTGKTAKRPAEVTPVPMVASSTTKAAKRIRRVTPKRITKLAPETPSTNGNKNVKLALETPFTNGNKNVKLALETPFANGNESVKPVPETPSTNGNKNDNDNKVNRQSNNTGNFYQDVHRMLSESTVENPRLLQWSEDGTAFFYNDDDKVELTQWIGKFEFPKWESFRRRLNMYGFKKHFPYDQKAWSHANFHRDLEEADFVRLLQLHSNRPRSIKRSLTGKMASKPTCTTTRLVAASKKNRKKSPVVKKAVPAVNLKSSGVRVATNEEASEPSKDSTTLIKFTTEVVQTSNDGVGVKTPVAVKRPATYSPGDGSSLPLSVLADAALGCPQAGSLHPGSLPFDVLLEAAVDTAGMVARGASFTNQAETAPLVIPAACIPVGWSSATSTLADIAFGLQHHAASLSLDPWVSPCPITKKPSAVEPMLGLATLLARGSVAVPTAGLSLAHPTHAHHGGLEGVPVKMSFANGVSSFESSPMDAALVAAIGDFDNPGRLSFMEAVLQYASTPSVQEASRRNCPATPVKWSGDLSAFSPISISTLKGPSPLGTVSESLVGMSTSTFALRLGELHSLSDEELLVGQIEAV